MAVSPSRTSGCRTATCCRRSPSPMPRAAASRRLEHLGVRHLRAVVGPSYGGFQSFQWAVTYPNSMDALVPVVSSPRAPRRDRVATLLARFERDPKWNGGDNYCTAGMNATVLA